MGSLVVVLDNIHIAKLASGFPLEDLKPVNTSWDLLKPTRRHQSALCFVMTRGKATLQQSLWKKKKKSDSTETCHP